MDRHGDDRFDSGHRSEPSSCDDAVTAFADWLDSDRARAADGTAFAVMAALEGAGIGVLHRDADGCVVAVNERYCAIVDRTADALLRLSIDQILHPDDAARDHDRLAQCTRSRTPFHTEARISRPDGAAMLCALDLTFARDGSIVVIIRDVTARRAAEAAVRESEEHARYSIELNPQISWTAAPDGRVDSVSPRWSEITGEALGDAMDAQWLDHLHPDDVPETMAAWQASVDARRPVDVEYRLATHDNVYRWFRARAAARLNDAGEVVRWYGTLEDIHDRKLAERALRESEERFRLAAQASGIGIWDYDAQHDRREWSDEFKAMLGLSADIEPSIDTALARVVPEDRHSLLGLIAAVAAGDCGHRFETTVRILRADTGAERWMKTGGWRIEAPSGRLGRVLVTIRDVTEERTAEERIRWAAAHDAMTRLPNRAAFGERLERAIAQATYEKGALALVLFDVDHLKETNDTVGHDAGDILLQTCAARLTATFGQQASLARLGGDEFAAILEATDESRMTATVQAALHALREPFTHEGRILDCQATAGGSLFPRHGEDAAELLKSADIALYAAKERNRGGLLTFRPDMRADIQRRSSMISIARDAARDRRIMPFYQPKVLLATNRVCGFEALLRWRHHQLGVQLPGTIAAAFEDLDLAVAMSDLMMEHIVADMREWLDEGLDFGRIAVNLSPAEFRHDSLVSRVLERLHTARIPTSCLELEVTETVFLGRGAESVAQALETFSREGVTIALDDFGTGYASLTHLKAFPVDSIKIDRSFVSSLDTDAGDAAIIDAVVGLGHRLGMEVVAEGVETPAQARYLLDRGCDCGQGYLFGKSVAAREVGDILRRGDMQDRRSA